MVVIKISYPITTSILINIQITVLNVNNSLLNSVLEISAVPLHTQILRYLLVAIKINYL